MKESPLQRCGCGYAVRKKKNNMRDEEEYNGYRSVSELPEHILEKIVSLLPPLKQATAISILSKQWRYIWTFTKYLDFDAHQTLNRLLSLPPQDYHTLIKDERLNYIDWVNSVIDHRSKNNSVGGINRFSIDFDLCREFSSSIDKWIKFAMKNGVQVLELNLFEVGRLRVFSKCYILRKKLFSPRVALKSLKVLNLISVDISGKVVEWLLSNCPLLERLQVIGSYKLINLRILEGGPLKHLELMCFNMKKVEIRNAQNLVSLYYNSFYYRQFLLRNVPKLVDLSFHINGQNLPRAFTLLSSCLSQLQILQLDLSFLVRDPVKIVYPMLTNLKQLKLILAANENLNQLLSRIIPFLKVSPCLQRLELMMKLYKNINEWVEFIEEPTNCPLKEVEILGYSGRPNEDQLIIYFAENLVALEKIIVHPSEFSKYPVFTQSKDIKTIMEEEKVRDHAMKHIKEKIPITIKFVFL